MIPRRGRVHVSPIPGESPEENASFDRSLRLLRRRSDAFTKPAQQFPVGDVPIALFTDRAEPHDTRPCAICPPLHREFVGLRRSAIDPQIFHEQYQAFAVRVGLRTSARVWPTPNPSRLKSLRSSAPAEAPPPPLAGRGRRLVHKSPRSSRPIVRESNPSDRSRCRTTGAC